MYALIVLALLGGPGFFERDGVDFWRARSGKVLPAPPLWAGSNAPPPVRRLLEAPGPETARAYLDWQRQRMSRLRAALAALAEERRPAEASILYFARPDCRFCVLQDRELEGLPVVRVEEGSPLWTRHRVTVTPTLVVGGRTFRGFTPRSALLRELKRD